MSFRSQARLLASLVKVKSGKPAGPAQRDDGGGASAAEPPSKRMKGSEEPLREVSAADAGDQKEEESAGGLVGLIGASLVILLPPDVCIALPNVIS